MKTVRLAGWSLCGVLAMTVQAADPLPLQPQDFAQGMRLQTEGTQPFYRLPLPVEAYTGTVYPDLRDLRVFNADGEPLPHTLVAQRAARAPASRIVLQSFLLNNMPTQDRRPDITITTLERGVTLKLSGDPGNTVRRAEYLLRTTQDDKAPVPGLAGLRLDWPASEASWQQRVQVEGSEDLIHWQRIAEERPVLDLREAGQRFAQQEVNFDYAGGARYRYLRLRFNAGFAPTLSAVEGLVVQPEASEALVDIAPEVVRQEDGSVHYRFVRPQPIHAVRITPEQANSLLPLQLDYRTQADGNWTALRSLVAYRLNGVNGEQLSPPVDIGGVQALQLRLRPAGPGWGNLPPHLIAQREARELVFNARGNGPFLLAWGSRAAHPVELSLATLLPGGRDALDGLPYAAVDGAQVLGGEERLTALAPAERTQRWQTVLVWLALIVGALALAALAWKVWREMRAQGDASNS